MSAERAGDRPPGVLDVLLGQLRLPQRIVAEIGTIAAAVVSLSDTADERLQSIDERAGALVETLDAMGASLTEIGGKVDQLTGLEAMVEKQMEAVREDLNERMLSIEGQLREIQTPITQMMHDVAEIKQLLPDPADGPLARLKDQLTKD
jgi:prefoldin subunit 5